MPDLLPIISDLAWPFALAIAWIAGEFGHRWTGLPRISIYGLVGFYWRILRLVFCHEQIAFPSCYWQTSLSV